MSVEAHTAYSKQWAIIDFKPDGNSCVAYFLMRDSDICLRMAQLIQSGANGEGDPMERRWIGRFSERRREFFVLQHFFDLFLREQPGALILHFGKKRQLPQMKNQSQVIEISRKLSERRG